MNDGDDWLIEAHAQAADEPQLAPLAKALDDVIQALRSPLRVAIVGLIKAGKSTLVNALLGEHVLPVGVVETTYTVASLAWSETPSLRLQFKDGRPPRLEPYTDLDQFVRRGADLDLLRSIAQVEIGYPNALLRRMTLIDTPGLGSTHVHDSENTLEALGLLQDAEAATRRQAQLADAVLYVFSRSLHESDQAVLSALQGAAFGRVSPLNALAALSKVDLYWPSDAPLASGGRIASRLSQHAKVRRTLYSILPVAGQAAGGGISLTAEDRAALGALAALSPAALDQLLSNDQRFTEREDPAIPVPPAARLRLLEQLGGWGVWSACAALRETPDVDLATALSQRSGMALLRDTLLRHFGNRTRLIKLNTALPALRGQIFRLRQSVPPASIARQRLNAIGALFERAERTDLSFAQLTVLQDYYAHRLMLDPDEAADLRAVTGEGGHDLTSRLGLGADSPPEALRRRVHALVGRWNAVASGADGRMGATQASARVIARSYEDIALQLDLRSRR